MLRRRFSSALTVLVLITSGCTGAADSGVAAPDKPSHDDPAIAEVDEPEGPGTAVAEQPQPTAPDRADPAGPAPVRSPASGRPAPSADQDHPPLPSNWAELQAMASSLLAPAVSGEGGAAISALVTDGHGRELLSHRADEAVLPASTLKLATAAAALVTFGPHARFSTRVETNAPIDAQGRVAGDLLLVGTGDPVLSTDEYARWVYPARLRTPLEALADAVVDAGVERVDGGVIGVAERFDGPSTAEGWPDRYFSGMDARFAAGLTVDAGLRTLVSYPEEVVDDENAGNDGESDGEGYGDRDPPDETTAGDATTPDDERQTGRENVDARRDPDVTPTVRVEHTADPVMHAATELTRLLEERGVDVRGEVGAPTGDGPVVGTLGQVHSPPMQELLRFAVQRSDNHITDAVFRSVGRARTGVGSFATGERALLQVATHLGLDTSGLRLADGSGLSREDRATARFLVELDRAMRRTRHAGVWDTLMAVTGESGTLQRRLETGVTAGRFAGKTGTLRDVTAIVGTVRGQGAGRFHLAVLVNDPGAVRWTGRRLADELITLLAADQAGCVPALRSEVATAEEVPVVNVAC